MTIPPLVSATVLRDLAPSDEKQAVRLVLAENRGSTQFRFRGITRTYIFTRDNLMGAHTLDVPLSIWMQDVPQDSYRQNHSIAHDVFGRNLVPVIPLIVPWGAAAEADKPAPEPVPPPPLQAPQAQVEKAQAQDKPEAHDKPETHEKPETHDKPDETPAARRMREKRARDKAARQEAEKAKHHDKAHEHG